MQFALRRLLCGAVGTVTNAPVQPGLALSEWRGVVDEAVRLGVMAFMIAGGEPFLLPGIAKLFRDYPTGCFWCSRMERLCGPAITKS